MGLHEGMDWRQEMERVQQANTAMYHSSYGSGGNAGIQFCSKPAESQQEQKVKDEILPDISLTRVFKWALVLIVAMSLGKKVWAMFGEKIEKNLHSALEKL